MAVTSKEREVLAAVGERLTNAEIAARLYISERTVETHVSSLRRKYQAASRRDLIRVAMAETGWSEVGALPVVLARALDSGPLVGRRRELEQLMAVWSEVTHGRSRTVLLGGEAGIGKTRFVAELAFGVHAGGGKVVFGACDEDELRPFGPFAGVIDGIDGDRMDRPSGAALDNPNVAAEQARAVALLRDRVVGWGRQEPTLLVVEDVHWASPSTRRALRAVLGSADPCRLMVVVTSRIGAADVGDDVAVMLGEIDKAPGTVRVDLGGLTADDIAAMAVIRQRDVDAERVHSETGGNPLLVREVFDGPDRHSGSSVQGLLVSRSRRLTAEDNALLDTAAVIGAEFDASLVADTVGGGLEEIVDALARCESVGLVECGGRPGQFQFVHALFRTVRLQALPASRRLRLHHRVAGALMKRPASNATLPALARHACASAPLGDLAFAVDSAMRAGDLLLGELAIEEAAELYRLGLSVIAVIEPTPAATKCELLVRLGNALAQIQDPSFLEILLDAARAAFDLGRLDIVADATWAARPINWLLGHDPAVLTLVQQTLAAIDPDQLAARARLTCVLSLHAAGLDNSEQRHDLMANAIELARATGQPKLLAQVFICHWLATFHPDTLDDRLRVADELLTIAQREHLPYFEIVAHGTRCGCLLEHGDVRAAAAEAAEVERIVRTRHDTFARPGILFRRAGIQFMHGELEAAEATAREFAAVKREMGQNRPDLVVMHGIHHTNLRLAQGRYDELVAGARAVIARHPDLIAAQAVLAMVLARTGRFDETRAILTRLLAHGMTAIPPDAGWYATVPALGDAAHVINDPGCAQTLAEALEPYAGRYAVQSTTASVPIDVIRAELALTLNQPARAATIAAGAAAHAESHQAPIFSARALVIEAAAHDRAGQHDAAKTALRKALPIAERTGAQLITLDAQRLKLL